MSLLQSDELTAISNNGSLSDWYGDTQSVNESHPVTPTRCWHIIINVAVQNDYQSLMQAFKFKFKPLKQAGEYLVNL